MNRDIVLELIRIRAPISRVEVARLSGLQASTVSYIVGGLIDEGWIREGSVVRPRRGRPSTMLQVNDRLATFALDIRPDRAILAAVDLSGRFLSRKVVLISADPEVSVGRILEQICALMAEHSDRAFQGVGVSVPGRVAPETQRILLAPNLAWGNYDLRHRLQEELQLQVEIENDANACLLSEAWSGRLDGVRNAVLVAVSEGIGTAILAGGQFYAGSNGLAGEFGHIPIDSTGPLCACGQRGCWEVCASSRAALEMYSQAEPDAARTDIYGLLRLTEENNPSAVDAVSRQARALGRGLSLVVAALAPELVLITGEITSVWERFSPLIEEELSKSMLAGTPPRIETAGDGEFARLRGAAAVLLQRHVRYHRSTHAHSSRAERRVSQQQSVPTKKEGLAK